MGLTDSFYKSNSSANEAEVMNRHVEVVLTTKTELDLLYYTTLLLQFQEMGANKYFGSVRLPSRPAALLGTVALGILRNAGYRKGITKEKTVEFLCHLTF